MDGVTAPLVEMPILWVYHILTVGRYLGSDAHVWMGPMGADFGPESTLAIEEN